MNVCHGYVSYASILRGDFLCRPVFNNEVGQNFDF